MLSQDEENYLSAVLNEHLVGVANIPGTLRSVLSTECMNQIGCLDTPKAYALQAVRVCSRDKLNHRPSWLSLLLRLLPNDPKVDSIRRQIDDAKQLADPLWTSILACEAPFLNRNSLRHHIQSMVRQPATRPILVVNGPRRTGKTYTADFIRHLYLCGAGPDYCYIALPEGFGLTYGPDSLAAELLTSLAVVSRNLPDSFYMNTTNSERWPYELAGRVLNEASGRDALCFLILDGFNGEELRPDTARFVDSLAARILGSAAFMRTFRLVLLDFDTTKLSVPAHMVEREEIALPAETEIFQCVDEILSRAQRTTSPEETSRCVQRIVSDLPQDEHRMEEINQRLLILMGSAEVAHV